MRKKIVIGIAGRTRAGKDTVARVFADECGAATLSSSDALYETLSLFGVPGIRKNSQSLSIFLRKQFGEWVLQAPVINRVEQSTAEMLVVTSLRREADYFELKTRSEFYLLYVDAPLESRYERFIRDLKDASDEHMSFAEFSDRDAAESEMHIDALKPLADCVISNDGDFKYLENQILSFVGELNKKVTPK